MPAQPSWLASAPVAPDAPALAIWDGSGLERMSHADVARFVGDDRDAFAGTHVPGAARAGAMLRAFAAGETFALAPS